MSSEIYVVSGNFNEEAYLEPCQTSKMDLSVKLVNANIFCNSFRKKLHIRCFPGFRIRVWNVDCNRMLDISGDTKALKLGKK